MPQTRENVKNKRPLIMGRRDQAARETLGRIGRAALLATTAIPTVAIVFIIVFIAGEALPFFSSLSRTAEFFLSTTWAPSNEANPHFGALSIFYGTAMVTVGSCAIAVPLGIVAAVCLSEIVNPKAAQCFKPVVELLAAIPSVAYGFFAMIVLAPLLQNCGGAILCALTLIFGSAAGFILSMPLSDFAERKIFKSEKPGLRKILSGLILATFVAASAIAAAKVANVEISSGTNALNASAILAIMALPTIVSISQDALNSVGRDMREGALALGATRFESIFKVVLPCAKSGIAVAVILGLMRVVGETMVVWMASGNSLKIPEPFYNYLEPVRTLTATIAGEMGEADQSTGSARYHALFAMSFCLLAGGLLLNAASQWVSSPKRTSKK